MRRCSKSIVTATTDLKLRTPAVPRMLLHPSVVVGDRRPARCQNEFILFKEVNTKTILANDISSLV